MRPWPWASPAGGPAPGPRRPDLLQDAMTLVGTAGANVLAWLQGAGPGALVTGLTVIAFGVIGIVSGIKQQRAKVRDKIFADRQKVERREKAENIKAEIRLQKLQEAANRDSLVAKAKALEARVADLEHVLDQTENEGLRRENREIELERRLHEAYDNIAALHEQLNRVQGQVHHVEGHVVHVEDKVDTNTRKIDQVIEQSGAHGAVRPEDLDGGGATTG